MKPSNPQAQSEQNQTTDSTIKFHYAENGEINICNGQTIYSNLFMFGAFALTSKFKCTSDAVWHEYQTDLEGLKTLDSKISEGITLISNSVASLGLMMALIDKAELDDRDLDGCAWLVAGLGELIGQLSCERNNISHSLQVLSKEPARALK